MHRKQPHFDWLDYGRFFAAMSVVLFHYLANGPRNGKLSSISGFGPLTQIAEYGYLGVDFFFMISGFVILFSAQNSTAERFLVSRAVRLWPAFIFCMTATALVRIFWGGPTMDVTLYEYLANLTMMPKKFGQESMDGVYWTLLLEIYFYTAVLIVIATGLIGRAQILLEAWIVVILTYWLADGRPPLLGNYSIFFASGCVLSFTYRDGVTRRNSVALAICAALAVAIAVGSAEQAAVRRGADLSPVVVGLIIASFFAAFITFATKRASFVRLPAAKTVGALTYPLYLLHAYIGYIVLSRLGTEDNKWFAVPAMIVAVILASFAVNKLVEELPRHFLAAAFHNLC